MLNHPLWQSQIVDNQTCYTSDFAGTRADELKTALDTCAAKAVSLLDKNIQENSLYLLCEWHARTAQLSIVVTDADKRLDGPYTVSAKFPDLQLSLDALSETECNEKMDALNDNVKFLLSDFLASYSPFFSYSLVAIFHSSSRTETSLL